MVISATVTSATAADSMGLRVFTEARAFAEVPVSTRSQERTPVRSVALITAEMCEVSLPAGNRVLAVVSMVAVSMEAVADAIGNYVYEPGERIENL